MLFFRHRLHLGVGIFSKFKKKGESAVDEDEAAARRAANGQQERERLSQAELQREIARATAMKIDAIEAAMAADIFDEPEPVFRRPARAPTPPVADDDHYPTELLEDQDTPAEAASAESAPLVEEVAILYASGEAQAAAQLLRDGIGAQDRVVWWMLFDLYQILGQQEEFDRLSIGYASTFETSPPDWNPPHKASAHSATERLLALTGMLNEEAADQIGRLRETAANAQLLRLDLGGVSGAEPVGCALLLQALREIERPGLQLVLSGAAPLCARLRAAPREQGESPWLLLLELLRLQNHESEFEEASMDYCMAFEVSPPPFIAPVRPPHVPAPAAGGSGDRFMLPQIIKADDHALFAGIAHYAETNAVLVFDCSQLVRIEFTAATQLMARLQALQDGRRIEFRALNHPVAALLRLVGLGGIARLNAHHY
jgi:ABC-type transporter Mla MlaB component